jgi:hypothetical protein
VIIQAEEVWKVTYAFGVAVRAAPSHKSQRVGNMPQHEVLLTDGISFCSLMFH